VGQKNVPAEMDVDIILDEVPDFAALQSEQFAQLSDLAGKGMPIPPEAIIQASSLRDKDKILKMMRGETEDGQSPQTMQMQQQLQTLQQTIEGLTQENEQLKQDRAIKQQEVQIKGAEATIKGYEAETDRMRLDRETKAKLAESEPAPEPAQELAQDQAAMQMQTLVQMLAQAMQQQAERQEASQAHFAEQIIGAIQESSAQTLQGIEQVAQTLMAELMQPRTVRTPSGRTIKYDPSTGEMQNIQ
jgi:hypothetical protein